MTNQTTNSDAEPNIPAVEKAIKRFHAALACTCDRTGRHQPWCRVFDANAIKDEEKSDLRIAALVLYRELAEGPVKERIVGTLRRLAGAGGEPQAQPSAECCAGERVPSVEQKCVTCPYGVEEDRNG